MYTQCPDCTVAFRVTADVLRQAAGKVRCGGCGIAFNALDHLSEDMPTTSASAAVQNHVADISADSSDDDGSLPKSISAEQSAALLKTLDELAGEDIRIEDTGVEWRVLDAADVDDDEDADEEDEDAEDPSLTETGSLKFVLQALDDDEAPDDLDDDDEAPDDLDDTGIGELDENAITGVHEELRFDDNTPLPDDFDLDAAPAAAAPKAEAPVESPIVSEEPDNAQADLALGEPDEWQDLLGEVAETAASEAEAVDTSEPDELAAIGTAVETDAEADLDRDVPPDMDTQFALQAEAMGIDISGIHAKDTDAETEAVDEDLAAAGSEASELDDLEPDELAPDQPESDDPEIDRAEPDAIEPENAEPEDIELGDAAVADAVVTLDKEEAEAEAEEDDRIEQTAATVIMDDSDDDDDRSIDEELIAAAFEAEAAAALDGIVTDDAADDAPDPEEEAEAELSEEELTINRMIDQDLLAIAVEDDDGFTSTIVQKQVSDSDDIPEEKQYSLPKQSAAPLFETIVMEGDSISGELDHDAGEQNGDGIGLSDAKIEEQSRYSQNIPIRGGRRRTDPPSYGVIAGAIALLVILLLQVMHQTREALATVPLFEKTVAPLYRMAGQPVTPAWNIRGWRFEATKGSTDEADQVLTIYSRVGNKSEKELPYPLIHVSLTDRFEEVIGSKVLEPSAYLVGNADPRRPVRPGTTFNAVISIVSPSTEATGFKLNVCYRQSNGELRCAIEDFK